MKVAYLLGPALTGLLVPVMIVYFARAAAQPAARREGKSWRQYGIPVKVFACVTILIPIALTIVWFTVEPEDKTPVSLLIALFTVLGLPLFLEAMFVKIGFDAAGIHCYSPWRKHRRVAWGDVGKPRFSGALMWWVIPTRGQGFIRVHQFISGASDLLAEIERRQTPNKAMDATA